MNVFENFRKIFNTYGDPRMEGLLLMSSPLPTLCICLSYTLLVTKIGPMLMKNREPFKLRNTIICYNFLIVLLSSFIFYETGVAGWFTFYSYRCQPIDRSNNPIALRMLRACYIYYLSKFFEFVDTILFVLRKNNHQISTLHVIHHGIMPITTWLCVKFIPGGHITFAFLLNSFVHIIMYSYYMVAALGPQYKKYLWWKKYLTAIQMLQFIAIGVHSLQLFFIDCNYPKPFIYLITSHTIMFFYLFYKFYVSSYTKGASEKQSEKKSKVSLFIDKSVAGMCFPEHKDDVKLE